MRESNDEVNQLPSDRRNFIQQSIKMAALAGVGGLTLLSSCKKKEDDEGQKVSPPEDLMQEHGLLNRVLLIYDNCRMHLSAGSDFNKEALFSSAGIIKTFVEDYHEKQEEDFLFPRFRKANELTDLVQTLLDQHNAGRKITAQILAIGKSKTLTAADNQKLVSLLDRFNTMYRPHEAREDTVLFPAFRKIISSHEYDSLGEEFEKSEKKKFGEDGFETVLNKVASHEKQLGIYDLAKFTPNT
jgi:hemerythrin-like domain-containing protein